MREVIIVGGPLAGRTYPAFDVSDTVVVEAPPDRQLARSLAGRLDGATTLSPLIELVLGRLVEDTEECERHE